MRVRSRVASAVPSGEAMKAGSACVVAALRWLARGRAIASGRDAPSSSRSSRTCETVVMIDAPPGEPTASNGLPWRVTIVGAIELRGRLRGPALFGWSAESMLKSVSSLLSRNPCPGTTMPLPPVDSIVNV